jgi:uncharacterized membrane protein YeaQ/YmgE (transglycosylase-associated protein family)
MLINVNLGNLIIMLVIGLAAGFLANLIIGRRNSSILNSFLIGIAGAFIGGWLLPMIGLRPWGVIGNFVTATVGALLLLFVARLLSSRTSV